MAAPAPSEADETTVSLLDVAAPVDDAPNSETPPPKTRRLYVLVDWRHRDRAFDVLATDGDEAGNNITSLVTYSCPDSGTDSQMFFLSRKPYFVPPTTFDSMAALAANAIANFDDHQFTLVKQAQGWCNYPFAEEAI